IYSDLLVAIQENQFELHYQLQNRDDASYIGAESLIRWNHPKQGLVSPFKFIPIAENSGLIVEIGTWVLQSACKQLAVWQENSKTKEWILAVNVSAKQFAQDDFLTIVKKSIEMYSINPNRLKIELTESLLADDFEAMVQKMQKLRELGIQISIDDFGTGYSSLQYLKMLPINQIKIDQGFIFEMLENHSDQIIVQSIINLGEAFGFDVIAEGVETEEHFEKLKEFGCHYFQGYLFARPEPIENIEKVVAQL
ncbi:bifunctional diguanylate cyclase/phosphodiesterase, partial [Sulfurimonas sp.]|uniref:putative bifunctional diguanylate cyclase/phosphodiesterase n=1 Tax=Sulfurimonas sp. TaxID=2022749 RepID=UPI0026112AB5